MRYRSWIVALGVAVLVRVGAGAEKGPELKKAKEAIGKRTEQIREQLERTKLTHVFKDRSFRKALELVRSKCSAPIVIDPVVDLDNYTVPVEEVRNISLGAVLRLICGGGLYHGIHGEAIFITTSKAAQSLWRGRFKEPAKPTKAQEKLILTLSRFRTGVDFDKKPVKDAIALLVKKSKANIKLDSADDVKDMTVTVAVKDASLRSLLDLVCGTRMGWMIVDDSVLVGLPGALREKEKAIKAREEAKRKAEAEKKKAEDAKKKAEEAKKGTGEKAKKKSDAGKKENVKPAPKKDGAKGK
ncbi:MAG: hypothetical protein GXP25_20990 [Planctomycetes bacterium]|nr:hypothetical protein [Planctomycetota bacterium]